MKLINKEIYIIECNCCSSILEQHKEQIYTTLEEAKSDQSEIKAKGYTANITSIDEYMIDLTYTYY